MKVLAWFKSTPRKLEVLKQLLQLSTSMQREIEDLPPKKSTSIKRPIGRGVGCFR